MKRIYYAAGVGVGSRKTAAISASFNKFASKNLTAATQQKIANLGLIRVAGNIFESPSSQDFWTVTADGGIRRLTNGDEVDNGESIPAAPADNPSAFLTSVLNDLEF